MAKAETKTKVKKAEVVKPVYLPRATEKAYFEQAKRTYIFVAPAKASKMEIKAGISRAYNVTVEDVRVLTRKGKKTRFSRGKHAYPGTAFRQDHKFAYVTLKEGDKIAVFEEEETSKPAEKADKKAEKAEKKAEKKADKKAAKAEKKGDK